MIMMVWEGIIRKFISWLLKLVLAIETLYLTAEIFKAVKTFFLTIALICLGLSLFAQNHYLRGEVKDETGAALPGVIISFKQSDNLFHTEENGSFKIESTHAQDTLIFFLKGFKQLSVAVNENKYETIGLKKCSPATVAKSKYSLSSLTANLDRHEQYNWISGDETYASLLDNHFINTEKFPSTGVSLITANRCRPMRFA